MMKALKSKLAIGVIATGLVAGMGTAFAATDAGVQLQGWYNSASTAAKALIAGEFASYYGVETGKLANSVEASTNAARVNIATTGRAELAGVNKAIKDQNTAYNGQITAAASNIQGSIGTEYDAVVSDTNTTTNSKIAAIGVADAKNITNAVKNHEGVYTSRLNSGVEETRAAAVAELTQKILDTKTNLEALLAQEKAQATTEVKGNLDGKISALKAELEELTKTLQEAAQGRIIAKANELETAALTQLEGIVNGIQ